MNIKNKKQKNHKETSWSVFPTPYTLTPTPSSRGFTLIEMIVSVSIFTVVTFVAVGALLAITDANRKANAIRTTMDNLNFAMESMARNLRTGSNYACGGAGNCLGGGDSITFNDQDSSTVTYWHDTEAKAIVVNKDGSSLSITSPEVSIDALTFYVSGVGADGREPRVVISIKGTAGKLQKIKTTFNVQTTVSQRKVEQ